MTTLAIHINQKKRIRESVTFILAMIIYLLTFPRFEPLYGTGLDPSYIWAFNFLIQNDYSILTGLTYPIGPFGFLKYVAAYDHNLLFGLLFYSLVKMSFIYLLLRLSVIVSGRITIPAFLVTLLAAAFSGIDFSIIGSTVVLLLLQYIRKKGIACFVLANLFALMGLFIKSSIGIASYASIFSFFLVTFSSPYFSLRKLSLLMTLSIGLFLLSGIVVFGSFGKFYNYLTGILHLADGYSDSLALFPENNWWLLGGFLVTVFLVPFNYPDRNMKTGYFFLLFPLFALWKHAMGREDFSHAGMLFAFLFVFWAILFLLSQERRLTLIGLSVAGIVLYHANLSNIPGYQKYYPQLNGLTNFKQSVLNYKSFNAHYKSLSTDNLSRNVLNDTLRSKLDQKIVDVYPWDLSYIPANGLHWKPRVTLELGASTSAWLSRLTASSFRGPSAAEFVIFHLVDDKWGGKFGSLDGRYILNDEPLVIEQFLSQYEIREVTSQFLLLEKQQKDPMRKINMKRESMLWDTWKEVPESNRLLRLNFILQKTILGHLKSFWYKGEAYYIDYLLSDGRILTYRFLDSNAQDGLWVNPLILRPDRNYNEPEVSAIRLRCSNYAMVHNTVEVSWQVLAFDDNRHLISWFRKSADRSPVNLTTQKLDFYLRSDALSVDPVQPAENQQGEIPGGQYSKALELDLDTLWKDSLDQQELRIEVYCFLPDDYDGKAMLVLSIEGSEEDDWRSFRFSATDRTDNWQYGFIGKILRRSIHQKGKIKAYVWNNGSTDVFIDDLSITLRK
ncbi:MAG: hypothetical protein P8100_00085 [bacterium]